MVEDIEELRTKLQAGPFGQREVLKKAQIESNLSRTIQDVSAGVPESKSIRNGKR